MPQERPIVVVVPSYNNRRWCSRNLRSILGQRYSNFRCIYIDDRSTDGTFEAVRRVVDASERPDRVAVVRNKVRIGALANLYHAIRSCADEEIVAIVDGDDWLADPGVLARINRAYSDPDVWMTYGQYRWWPSGKKGIVKPHPREVIDANSFRDGYWTNQHLRTFYAWLFKGIKRRDLMYRGEGFYPMAYDAAIMFPMFEMAGRRSRFLPRVSYIYNQSNPLNENKVNYTVQHALLVEMRLKRRYRPLGSAAASVSLARGVRRRPA